MHICPHCATRGIGFVAKLLSNPVYPAVCRQCAGRSTKCSRVLWAQLTLAVVFLATVPELVSPVTARITGAVTALFIVGVGQIGPMCKRNA